MKYLPIIIAVVLIIGYMLGILVERGKPHIVSSHVICEWGGEGTVVKENLIVVWNDGRIEIVENKEIMDE